VCRLTKNSQINIDEETRIRVFLHGVVLCGHNETPYHLHKGLWDGCVSQAMGSKGRVLFFIICGMRIIDGIVISKRHLHVIGMGGKMPHAGHLIKTMQDMAHGMIRPVGFRKALCEVVIWGMGIALCRDPLPQRYPLGLRLMIHHGCLFSGWLCLDRDDELSSSRPLASRIFLSPPTDPTS